MSTDIIARALASRASSARLPQPARRLAFRIFGGRVAGVQPVSTNYLTFETLIGLACPAEAVRLVYAFGQTASGDAMPVRATSHVASVASSSDADIQGEASARLVATFDGNAILEAQPSSDNQRRRFYRSDWIAVPSRRRTDRFPGALYAIRTTLFTASGTGNSVLLGNGADDYSNWANHPSGRLFRSRSKLGVASSQWTSFTTANSTASKVSPIVGVEYLARGKVVSVAGFGDSITEGRSTFLGEGFGHAACGALSENSAGIAFEWSNLGWSGQGSRQIYDQVQDCADFGLVPGIATLPVFSPNGFGSSPSQSAIAAMQYYFARAMAKLEEAGCRVIQWTGLPISPSVYDIGNADEMRRQVNADAIDATLRGLTVCDFASRIEGDIDADGQTLPVTGLLADGIHPSDAGNSIMADILTGAIRAQTGLAEGYKAA